MVILAISGKRSGGGDGFLSGNVNVAFPISSLLILVNGTNIVKRDELLEQHESQKKSRK